MNSFFQFQELPPELRNMVYGYAMEDHVVEIYHDDATGNFGMRSIIESGDSGQDDGNAHIDDRNTDEGSETEGQHITAFPLSKVCREIRAEIDMERYYANTKFVVGDFASITSLPRPPLSLPPSSNRSLANPVYRAAVKEVELSKSAYNSYKTRNMPTFSFLPRFPSLRWNGFVGLEKIYLRVGPTSDYVARGTWSRTAWIDLTWWSSTEKRAVMSREGYHSELVLVWN